MKSFRQYLLENEFAANGRFSPFKGGVDTFRNYRAERGVDLGVGGSGVRGFSEKTGEMVTVGHVGPVSIKGADTGPAFLKVRSIRLNYDERVGPGRVNFSYEDRFPKRLTYDAKKLQNTSSKSKEGVSFVISLSDHKGKDGEEIHRVFVPDDADYNPLDLTDEEKQQIKDGTFDPVAGLTKLLGKTPEERQADTDKKIASDFAVERPGVAGPPMFHEPLSARFRIHPDDVKMLLHDHLRFEFPRDRTPENPRPGGMSYDSDGKGDINYAARRGRTWDRSIASMHGIDYYSFRKPEILPPGKHPGLSRYD
jgi:hypothetical protein